MDMQNIRLADILKLQTMERDFIVSGGALSSLNGPEEPAPQPVPMLHWPANLFADDVLH